LAVTGNGSSATTYLTKPSENCQNLLVLGTRRGAALAPFHTVSKCLLLVRRWHLLAKPRPAAQGSGLCWLLWWGVYPFTTTVV